ncbi:MAG TPA: ABC transporter ATP-binding protein [Ruminiclostridium sp.]|nr:ABC transporter ATP-binding protein [Ruminiclostridium sp.]
MGIIEFVNVSKVFKRNGAEHVVLKGINLKVETGQFVCITGSSGCGKTTLLNLILGICPCTGGTVFVKGRAVNGINYECAAVFQDSSLFPWLTVAQNVEFGPKMRGIKGDGLGKISDEYLEMVGLRDCKDAFVHELSGGMKQRVALSRALATGRDILIFDEPFSALDQQNREAMQLELLSIKKNADKTIVMVTHSEDEAFLLGDRIIKLCPETGNIGEDLLIKHENCGIPLREGFSNGETNS